MSAASLQSKAVSINKHEPVEVEFRNKYAINAEDGDELIIKESDENLLESSCSLHLENDDNKSQQIQNDQRPNQASSRIIHASYGSASSKKKV